MKRWESDLNISADPCADLGGGSLGELKKTISTCFAIWCGANKCWRIQYVIRDIEIPI